MYVTHIEKGQWREQFTRRLSAYGLRPMERFSSGRENVLVDHCAGLRHVPDSRDAEYA